MASPTAVVNEVATLQDTAGNAIANETVSFYHRTTGATSFPTTPDGTATTDSNGKANFSVTLQASASYDFEVAFSGDSNYLGSTAIVSGIIVKAGSTLTLVIIS